MMKYMQNYYVEMNNIVRIESDNSAMWVLPRHTMFTSPTPKLLCASYFGQQHQSFSQSLRLWTSLSPCYSQSSQSPRLRPDDAIHGIYCHSQVRLSRSHNQTWSNGFLTGSSCYSIPFTHCTQLMFQKQSCEHTSSKPKRLKKCPSVWKISPEVLYNFP